jgi:vacuolar-type H+-ATPase subunit D/Vma8
MSPALSRDIASVRATLEEREREERLRLEHVAGRLSSAR